VAGHGGFVHGDDGTPVQLQFTAGEEVPLRGGAQRAQGVGLARAVRCDERLH